MSDRHPKWVRVEPGTVIPAGQPRRHEFHNRPGCQAIEQVSLHDYIVGGEVRPVYVDSSWKPPLVLPTEPTWGIAVVSLDGGSQFCGRWTRNALEGLAESRSCDLLDFIPLTDEQVKRIEAAR